MQHTINWESTNYAPKLIPTVKVRDLGDASREQCGSETVGVCGFESHCCIIETSQHKQSNEIMYQVKIAQQDYVKIVDYLIWMQSTPDSIKDQIDMEQAERSLFGQFGYEEILADAIDDVNILDDYVEDYDYHINADKSLKMSINDKIVIEFVPE